MTARFVNEKLKMLRNMGATGDIIKHRIRIAKNYDLIAFFNHADEWKSME